MKKFLISILFLTVVSMSMVACDGSSSSSLSFINWISSYNGEIVVDATNDHFKFTSPEGYLYFGNTTYDNFWVDSSSNLYFNGEKIGSVAYIKSDNDHIITGLVSTTGYLIDIYGPEDDLKWQISSIRPIFVTVNSKVSADDIDSLKAKNIINGKSGSKVYFGKQNAFADDNDEPNERTIGFE